MRPRCPHCRAGQRLLRGAGKYDCPACGQPLRLHNGLALVAAFIVVPVAAGVFAGFACDAPACSGSVSLALSAVLGLLSYAALLRIERAA